jgi:hypothetical protein
LPVAPQIASNHFCLWDRADYKKIDILCFLITGG